MAKPDQPTPYTLGKECRQLSRLLASPIRHRHTENRKGYRMGSEVTESYTPRTIDFMIQYPKTQRVLENVFSSDYSFSADESKYFLMQILSGNPQFALDFKNELIKAFSDRQLSWSDMMLNEKCEVAEFDSEHEARQHAICILWDCVFPDRPPPNIDYDRPVP